MSDIERSNDIAERMLARLRAQFVGLPRIEAVVRAFANQLQKSEQTFYDLYWRRMLDNAEDQDLDNIGELVGEARQGWDDDEYRSYIRARIKTLRSDGKIETLIAILAFLYSNATFDIREFYPAALVVEVVSDSAPTLNGEYVNRGFLQKAKGAGVNLDLVVSPTTRGDTLLFDDDISPFVNGPSGGLSDDGGSPSAPGGRLASRYG